MSGKISEQAPVVYTEGGYDPQEGHLGEIDLCLWVQIHNLAHKIHLLEEKVFHSSELHVFLFGFF